MPKEPHSSSGPGSSGPLAGRPVIFGEALFDVFPDGRAVLGGASFNVAWNLRGFGVEPLFISRIGDDERGRLVLEAMERWAMDPGGVQLDRKRPTGVVRVEIERGEPRFDILGEQAYDFIEAGEIPTDSDGSVSLLYHGTLAARSPVSRAALGDLLERLGRSVFVDVNLRDPWWSAGAAREAMRRASWVKLNAAELSTLSEKDLRTDDEIEAEARRQRRELDLDQLIITLGANGALMVRPNDEILDCQATALPDLEDTVGAGDAFSAVMILGLSKGWPLLLRLKRAVEFAAHVCTLRGATSEDASLYRGFVERWDAEGSGSFSG